MEPASGAGIWQRIARWYARAMMALGCALLGSIVVIMGVQVFFRYVLNDSLIWAEEVSRYFLVWISFLFLGIAFQRGELISLSLLLRAVPRIVQILLTVIAYGASLTLLAALVWYGFKFAEVNALQTLPAFDFIWSAIAGDGETLDVSAYWLYASVPVGAALLSVHMLLGLISRIRRLLAGERIYDDEVDADLLGSGTR